MSDNWNGAGGLLSDEPTVELITRARTGDSSATEALMQRCLPALKRWAHGKLPAVARSYMDTGDLVQEAALNAIRHLDTFEPRRVGAMQAYLVQSVINRIRDEVRRVSRRGVTSGFRPMRRRAIARRWRSPSLLKPTTAIGTPSRH